MLLPLVVPHPTGRVSQPLIAPPCSLDGWDMVFIPHPSPPLPFPPELYVWRRIIFWLCIHLKRVFKPSNPFHLSIPSALHPSLRSLPLRPPLTSPSISSIYPSSISTLGPLFSPFSQFISLTLLHYNGPSPYLYASSHRHRCP